MTAGPVNVFAKTVNLCPIRKIPNVAQTTVADTSGTTMLSLSAAEGETNEEMWHRVYFADSIVKCGRSLMQIELIYPYYNVSHTYIPNIHIVCICFQRKFNLRQIQLVSVLNSVRVGDEIQGLENNIIIYSYADFF